MWNAGDCQSPWFVWQTWKDNELYSDNRVCFDVTYEEWLDGHNGDLQIDALRTASKWQIKVPSENVDLEFQGELVRAVMYGETFNGEYGPHYKRTNSGEHWPWFDQALKPRLSGGTTISYLCTNPSTCGYSILEPK